MTESPLDDALELMRDLRKRCDWDASQSHESLRPYLIEESLELDDALRAADDSTIREELGDLLLQVLFHSVIAEERGAFDMRAVADGLIAKMKGRHPHLYGEGAREPWERTKSRKRKSIAEGLSEQLPPLHRAHRLQDRAAGLGFDWPNAEGPVAKVSEELVEVRTLMESAPVRFSEHGAPQQDEAHARLEAELGDLLFACVNLCRKLGVHGSLALDRANAKFQRRFERIEQLAVERGIPMETAGLETLDSLWDEVKSAELDPASER